MDLENYLLLFQCIDFTQLRNKKESMHRLHPLLKVISVPGHGNLASHLKHCHILLQEL